MSIRIIFNKYKKIILIILLIILLIFSIPIIYWGMQYLYDLGLNVGSNLRYLLKFGHFC